LLEGAFKYKTKNLGRALQILETSFVWVLEFGADWE
jgi:hypothetical protein